VATSSRRGRVRGVSGSRREASRPVPGSPDPRPSRPRPDDLVLDEGAACLSDTDLIRLLSGAGRESARGFLSDGGWSSLRQRDGRYRVQDRLGRTRAVRLTAALELARRLGETHGSRAPSLQTPREVFEVTADLRRERREHFVGLYCNARGRLLARETVSVGSLNASIVHPREVFEPALRHGAASLVVVHNHPSGETDPSEDDLAVTRRLIEAGEILGIRLLDHVIVGVEGYTSLKETARIGFP